MVDKTVKHIEQRGYSKGYSAGIKRRGRERYEANVKNDRATHLAASIMSSAMQGNWGKTDSDGNHKKHDLEQLEAMAVKVAERMTRAMTVYS